MSDEYEDYEINILLDVPIEILWMISDMLCYNDQLSLLLCNKDLFECLENKQFNFGIEKLFCGVKLHTRQLVVLSRIFDLIPSDCFARPFVHMNVIAGMGFGKTRIGLKTAMKYRNLYQVIIVVPNMSIMRIWVDELNLLGLYKSDPTDCDFLIVSKNRKYHFNYFQNYNLESKDKIIICTATDCFRSFIIGNNQTLLIKDEAHKDSMINCSNVSGNHIINLSATKMEGNAFYYHNKWRLPIINYIIKDKLTNKLFIKMEKTGRPILFTDSINFCNLQKKYKTRFNFWGGSGSNTMKKYEKQFILTILKSDIVEGVNFNLTNLIGLNCGFNHIRLGRVIQLLGRVIRESNVNYKFTLLHINPCSRRDIIKVKVAMYILQTNIESNDPDLVSTEIIDKLLNKISTMGYELNDLTGKELVWLFTDIELSWDFENFANESVLGKDNLLTLGFYNY